MINNTFKAELKIAENIYPIDSALISQTYGEVYPTINCHISDGRNPLDPTEVSFGTTASLTLGIYNELGGVVKTLAYAGIIAKAGVEEQIAQVSSSVVVAPTSAKLGYILSNFDGLTLGLEYSARKMINAIVARYNLEYPDNRVSSTVFNSKDFIPMAAPRFINMTYLDMIRQIAGERGLFATVGFDNRLIIFNYLNKSSTVKTISIDKLQQTSISTDILTKFMR